MTKIAQLPYKSHLYGAITQQKIIRLCSTYTVIFFSATLTLWLTKATQWHAFSLGLMFPGAGFLVYANLVNWQGLLHIIFAATSICLFAASLVLWFATGNAVAPLFVWLLSAIIAAGMGHQAFPSGVICGGISIYTHWLIPTAILIAFGLASGIHVFRQVIGKRQRQQANEYLQNTAQEIADKFEKATPIETKEFSLDDLKLMRFLLDRALQPIDSFDGFEWIDQFQTAAVRYQLNFLGYALSMAQATHLSAFGGYLDDAQRNLIIKQTDHRIWRYWQLENLWGNFRLSADPIAHDNIMYTGFCAAQIATFHAASGCDFFLHKNSFLLTDASNNRYSHNLESLVKKLDSEFNRSDYHLMACEPNWVYPLCNTIGATAMKFHDANLWSQHQEKFIYQLEHEFIDYSGRIIPCRSNYTGIAFPNIGGALPQALPCFFKNATMPDIALRQWMLLRRSLIKSGTLNRKVFWPIDTGNYGFSRAAAYAGAALAATELGDNEVAELCLKAIENEYPAVEINNSTHRPKASVWVHALEFLARSCVKNGFRQLIENTHKPRLYPIINEVNYPDVLVAHASYQKGVLKAVFYNGTQASLQKIGLANLTPHASYFCEGTANKVVIADANGNAVIDIFIDGRTKIQVYAAKQGHH